ncbi:hypothetical protein HBH92_203620 [Parastagonospora nodorum]|nr:hypothetical protein HBH46_135140 [Parastagonospora nodorum]KAH4403218.1 hypothetical protein HBH92_203620 [Parastagonospora nodorum]KAH4427619.1 hypothetical protein HBH93_166350 [Parastagonospora nodorum]KAH4433116.1 hypothetical protein HBH91_218890 [Parastagonospora nodorum]KAH4500526.1 hypothetical protein HBH89_115560 [Parastagonospora nodorum]
MDPSLTLEIPFVLLGRKDLKSSKYLPQNEEQTKPLEYINATLLALCPDILVHLIASSDQITPDVAWHLYPSPFDEDAILTVGERAKLSKDIWSCPAILHRTGISLDTSSTAWTLFTHEAGQIFSALAKLDAHEEPEIVVHGETIHLRPWSLVTPSQAQLRIVLVPGHDIHPPLFKHTLILAAALERKLTLLTTPSALLRYWTLSRFLEFRAVRQLGRKKAELWTEKGDAYAREERKWFARFDEEDRAGQRTKKRGREWWDVVDSVDMEDFRGFREKGGRLGVEPNFAGGHGGQVTGLAFQQFHSTLDAGGIVAYTEIIAGLAHMACDFEHTQLSGWMVEWRQEAPSQLRDGFRKLLRALHVSEPFISFFESYLDALYSVTASSTGSEPEDGPSHSSPFFPLTSHITHTLSSERAYIPTFIARYAAASGFHPRPTSKVYALMMADEQARTTTTTTTTRG